MKSSLIRCLFVGAALALPVQAESPATLFRSMVATDPNNDPNWDFWTNRSYTFYFYKDGKINTVLPSLAKFRSTALLHARSRDLP